jgi:5-methylthioadenosine/S-adenosylhomocysteine deaminase
VADRVLLKDGYVLSMDPSIGELTRGSVLVEGGSIVQVAADIDVTDADVIDARNAVILPGFVDTHRHTWQTQLRAICADMSLLEYMRCIRQTFSPTYRADDIYYGNLVGALEALNAGVTTILDYSHCNNSPEHADAGVKGLLDAGIRALYAYGYYHSPVEEPAFTDHDQRIADAHRIRETYFSSDDQLLTMGIAITETGMLPFEKTIAEIRSAHELGARVAAHTGCFWGSQCAMGVRELHHHGLLRDDQVHIHCNTLDGYEFRLLGDAGCKVSITPESEISMGMGHPVFRQCVDNGIEPTLSCDIMSLNSGDMFSQMRLGLNFLRCMENDPYNVRHENPPSLTFTVRDALRWATQNGANACGLGSKVGSLTPGKKADVIVVKSNDYNMTPLPEAIGSVVYQAHAGNVDAVVVNGRVVKRDGALVGRDFDALRRLADDSREYLFSTVLAKGPILPGESQGWIEDLNAMAAANVAQAYALPVDSRVPAGV